jgi:Ca2+-transporting ATPase
MERKPRPANAPIVTRAVGVRLVILGLIAAVTTLVVIAYGEDQYESVVALTMGLVTLSLMNIIAALEERDPERSVFDRHTVANRRFNLTILGCLALTVLVTELGFLQRIFDTTSLTAEQWGICLLAGLVMVALAEIVKLIMRQTGRASTAPATIEPVLQPAPGQ